MRVNNYFLSVRMGIQSLAMPKERPEKRNDRLGETETNSDAAAMEPPASPLHQDTQSHIFHARSHPFTPSKLSFSRIFS